MVFVGIANSTRNYDNENCRDQTHTKASNFSATNKSTLVNYIFSSQPGENLICQFMLGMMLVMTLATVYYAYTYGTASAKVEMGFFYVANNLVSITGKPDPNRFNITLALQPTGSRIMHVILNVTLNPCPPGFRLVKDSMVNNNSKRVESQKNKIHVTDWKLSDRSDRKERKMEKIPWVTHGIDLRHQTHEWFMGLIYVTLPMSDSWDWFTSFIDDVNPLRVTRHGI